jgi:hypothetical protein
MHSKLPLLFLPAALAAAACGGDDGVTIDIHGDRAELLAARVGDGAWQTLTANAEGKTSLEVDEPFELVGVCDDFGGEVYSYAAGPEDAELDEYAYDIGCGAIATAAITMQNTGTTTVYVAIGFLPVPVSPGESVSVAVATGVHDVVIVDRVAHQAAIRRDVNVTAGMTLTVDLTGGAALIERPVTLSDSGFAGSWVVTANGTRATLGRAEGSAWSLPPSLVATGDRHYVSVSESDLDLPRTRFRTAVLDPQSTAPVVLTLPPHLDAATLTWNRVPSAVFTSTGTWSDVSLFGYQLDDDGAPLWFALAYPHAARAAGSFTAADPTAIAGWNPAWNIEAATPFDLTLDLSRQTTDGGREGVTWWLDTTPPDSKRSLRAARAARTAQLERVLQRDVTRP